MRRKTGEPKRRALRRKPEFSFGFKDNPATAKYRNPLLSNEEFGAPTVKCVSMFSGCGGLDFGLMGGFTYLGKIYKALPFDVESAFDIEKYAIETYKTNISNKAYVEDLTKIPAKDLPKAQILLGGFPCQDYSSCGSKLGLDGERGRLFTVMAQYMAVHQPALAIGENVPYLERLDGGKILEAVKQAFFSVGYSLNVWWIRCHEYGLPQSRTRLFLVAVRNDLIGEPNPPEISLFRPLVPIDAAIDDLKSITDERITNQSQYFVATRATKGAGQGDQISEKGKIAYTVRANAKARIHFHYELDRRLTVRECARLQSFPDEFVFPHAAMNAMTQIGNAVPPIIAHLVGEQLLPYMNANPKAFYGHPKEQFATT